MLFFLFTITGFNGLDVKAQALRDRGLSDSVVYNFKGSDLLRHVKSILFLVRVQKVSPHKVFHIFYPVGSGQVLGLKYL